MIYYFLNHLFAFLCVYELLSLSNFTIFYVNDNGYYEFPDDIVLTDIAFVNTDTSLSNGDDLVSIQFVIKYSLTPASGSTISTTETLKNVIGQYSADLKPDVSFYNEIAAQHHFDEYDSYSTSFGDAESSISYKKSEISLQRWRGLSIESSQYAIFDIKWKDETEYTSIYYILLIK